MENNVGFFHMARQTVWNVLKRKYWYIFLLITSSLYVWRNRLEIYQLAEFNAQNLIFLLWLLLLLFPLFSEMEVLGVKFKKEVEQSKKEIQQSISALGDQIMTMQIYNASVNSQQISIQLPTEKEVVKLLENTKDSLNEKQNTEIDAQLNTAISEDTAYLLKVRLTLEKKLREICEIYEYKNVGLQAMTTSLAKNRIIDTETSQHLKQIIEVCNRGVHGEIMSEKYIKLVRILLPDVLEKLEENIF